MSVTGSLGRAAGQALPWDGAVILAPEVMYLDILTAGQTCVWDCKP